MRIGNWTARVLWLVGGLLLGLGVASLPSIGLFLIPAGILVLLLVGIVGRGRGWPLVLLGLAAPPLWVAWLHRGGPGERCWETPTTRGCEELLNPAPWLAAGLFLLLLFILALALSRRARRGHPSDS